jgi:hypothetical protein
MAWLTHNEATDRCATCGYDWALDVAGAREVIRDAPERYAQLLTGRDGMTPAADGGWNATAYVWHLVDLARSWSERWVQIADSPGSLLVGWDPDVLAEARSYRSLPTVPALWALDTSVEAFVSLCEGLDPATPFLHGEWGEGDVGDGIRWLAHEMLHHQLDVAALTS